MSTKVKIGSARIDERKKISGGKAGDQTKFEVSTQDFYQHPKGWLVLRPTAFAKEIAKNMKDACGNDNIGYSQTDRYSLMRALEKVDSFKEVKKCNCDCSSLVRECVRKAFKKYVPDFNTESEKFVLERGGFVKVLTNCKIPDQLKEGDILVTKKRGHTAIVVSVEKDKKAKKENIDDIVKRVIRGEFKTGQERYKLLKEAGYDPVAVQKKVNEVIANAKS